jgi:hypothetical protein
MEMSIRFEEFCLLGYNAMWSVESQVTFWTNMQLPSSGLNCKQTRNQQEAGYILTAGSSMKSMQTRYKF